jgi:GntR family transcriptional regulator
LLVDLSRERGGLPLYAQLAALLREQLQDGRLRPGSRLESEPALAARWGVSRATVAKALAELEREGLLRREQGRGTFARVPPLRRPLPELTGFSEHVTALGHKPGSKLVRFRRRRADAADPLTRPFEPAKVVVIRRVRLVDGEPVGLHRAVYPADLADQVGLTAERFTTGHLSVYGLLAEHGVQLARATEQLQARVASHEEAGLLGVPAGEPLMLVRRFSYDTSGRLVEGVDAHYLGTRYDYRIDLVRAPVPSWPGTPEEHPRETIAETSRHAGHIRVAHRRVR